MSVTGIDVTCSAVDAVVVSHHSRRTLRRCVESLVDIPGVSVYVVDNASTDDTLATIADLDVTVIAQSVNRGFAHGCNTGIAAGTAPYVLLLNPDAAIDANSLTRLVEGIEDYPLAAIAAPRILDANGSVEYSLRRFPRLRSTFAVALFAHRLFPNATWQDEVIRDPHSYAAAWSPPWVSGACMLAKRSLCEQLGGLDDRFFLYGEDVDFCRRARDTGADILFEPTATAMHAGGQSAPRPELLPVLAASRLRYARKHEGPVERRLTRIGVTLGAATHVLFGRGTRRRGHWRALRVALRPGNVDDPAAVAQLRGGAAAF